MATFTLSPGVLTREIDKTIIAQSQASLAFGFSGKFSWGPVDKVVDVSNYDRLVSVFGHPANDFSAVDHLVAQSYLAYGSARITRQGNAEEMANATDTGGGNVVVFNDDDFETDTSFSSEMWIAKYPGVRGNSIAVDTCTNAEEYEATLPGSFEFTRGSKTVGYTATGDEVLSDYFSIGDSLQVDGTLHVVADFDDDADTITLVRAYAGSANPTNISRVWRYSNIFPDAPAEGELHVIVTDEDGEFTDEAGTVLEVYTSLSTNPKAKNEDGTSAFYKTSINRRSQYIRVGGADPLTINETNNVDHIVRSGGVDGHEKFGTDEAIDGYSKFLDDSIDIIGLMMGAANSTVVSFALENIAEIRKDLVVTASPNMEAVVNNRGDEANDCVAWRKTVPYTSYSFYDCNWKKMYDRHNDTYRWIPTNGDTAGCIVRAIRESGVGYSPAGDDAGRIKNVDQLAWSPEKTDRDKLYVADINPIANFRGRGQLLYGDKTGYGKNSAFSQIGVRILFIVLEKTISRAASSLMFKFNDEVTRAYFVSMVDPTLRRRKGERVIREYKLIADETVNTDAVVEAQEFRGVIIIDPARSINGVRLDFVAQNGVTEFTETTITSE